MVATYRNIIKSWPDLPSIMMMIMMMMRRIVDMLILITTATTGGGALFQAGAPFSIKNAKFWPVLAIFGYFVTNLHTF